jgi:hypothetical protein
MDSLATLQVYKELTDWYERQGQAAMRDRFLILAAEAAFSAGKTEEAERLRQRLLQTNPHHMLKPFSSFAQALQSTNIQIYIHDLQVNYPPEAAESLLQNLRSGQPPLPLPPEGKEEPATDNWLGVVPQTAPLILFPDEPTLQLQGNPEPPKVIPLRKEPEPTLASPPIKPTQFDRPVPRKSTTAPPSSGKTPRSTAAETARSHGQPTIPLAPTPARPSRVSAPRPAYEPSPSDESGSPAGAWLTYLLFGMTVTAGLALAGYTLARPFLPTHWFR